MIRILVVHNCLNSFPRIAQAFKTFQAEAVCVDDPWKAVNLCSAQIFNLIIIDMQDQQNNGISNVAGQGGSRDMFFLLKQFHSYLPKVILIVSDHPRLYEPLIYEGVSQIIQSPVKIEHVISVAMEIIDSSLLFESYERVNVA